MVKVVVELLEYDPKELLINGTSQGHRLLTIRKHSYRNYIQVAGASW